MFGLPSQLIVDEMLVQWLKEDVGRGDFSVSGLVTDRPLLSTAKWVVKEPGIMAGLPIALRVFSLLDPQMQMDLQVQEGQWCDRGQEAVHLTGSLGALLMGERTALNLAMRLSGIATMTRRFVETIADLPTRFVDTRKTTPGLRLLEKYASRVGGAINHRMGLDDAVMIKDNHIAAAGGIERAITLVRPHIPYPMTIEVETEDLDQVKEALVAGADIIMLDNMSIELMQQAVDMIRRCNDRVKIEASGNISLETMRSVAETGVDYISSSAPVTRSPWLDLSMRLSPRS